MVKLAIKQDKVEIDEIIRNTVTETAKQIFDSTIDTGSETGGKKFSQVLKDIKNKPLEDKDKDKDKDKNEGAHKHEDDIDCPSCKTGHVHKLKEEEGVFKCTGPDCGKEYYLASRTPEFQCINCGTPVDKPPKELEDIYSCPTCGKDHFREFDKRKIKKPKK